VPSSRNFEKRKPATIIILSLHQDTIALMDELWLLEINTENSLDTVANKYDLITIGRLLGLGPSLTLM
jgi:hypothetical protein